MNAMQMLKNAVVNENRVIINFVLRRLGVDSRDFETIPPVAPCPPLELLAKLETPEGDQFYVSLAEKGIKSFNDLPVFSRSDLLVLRRLS